MKWLEIITLRSTGHLKKEAALELLEQVAKAKTDKTQMKIEIYQNAAVDSDICIHLSCNSCDIAPGKSSQGLRLAHLLHDFGFVNYTIWIREESTPDE